MPSHPLPALPGAHGQPPAADDAARLRYFATVADHLHFGRAATELRISRTLLSRTVTELEAELGVELFVRPSERTELTAAGLALRERARSLLAADDVVAATASGAAARAAAGTAAPDAATTAFTIAIAPGVIVSKWTKIWTERRPDRAVRVLPTDPRDQVAALTSGAADVSFVRLPTGPVPAGTLSLIPLYAEVAVVVLPRDHDLTLLESVAVADLVEEHLLQDPESVPAWRDAAAALRTAERLPLPAMESVAEAIALVAAGVGIVIVPQSVARQNHRKDVTYRPVTDAAEYPVALAWLAERTTADVEEFIGIVRGRSAHSSRAPSAGRTADQPAVAVQPARAAQPAPRPRRGGGAAGGATSAATKRSRATAKSRRPRGSR